MDQRQLGLAVLLGSFALAASAPAQQPARVETHDLGSGLAMLVGSGGNLGVSVGEDGVLLVDDQFARMTPALREAVRALGGSGARFVLNTHWHGDHVGGNESWARTGAVIVAHENVRARMRSDQWNALRQVTTKASPRAALPIVTFDEGIRFHLNGHEIDVLHVDPAHTDGDSIVVFRHANVIHAGDTYFNGLYPYIDVSSGGSVDGMIAAADRVLGLCNDETRVIPGHGPLSDRQGLAAYRDMLVSIRNAVRSGIVKGRTADQVVASKPSAAFDAKWGGGFLGPDDFVRIVHASLAGR
ncbi:MAG: MBL fold metallo-hydrolase [Myxococcota bacterium]|nr:MBL fold metallo-hydrolase [Myxococcota bacterium]